MVNLGGSRCRRVAGRGGAGSTEAPLGARRRPRRLTRPVSPTVRQARPSGLATTVSRSRRATTTGVVRLRATGPTEVTAFPEAGSPFNA